MKAPRLFALALVVMIAPAAQALEGKLVHLKVETKNVPGPVDGDRLRKQ